MSATAGASDATMTEAAKQAVVAAAKLTAFRSAACYLSAVFLLGLVALYFLKETKGQPMPEDGPAPARSAAP